MPKQNSLLITSSTAGIMKKENLGLETPLRLSRFAHEFLKDGITALYHSLTYATVFVEGKNWRELKQRIINKNLLGISREDKELLRVLREKKLLLTSDEDENEDLRKLQERLLGKPSIGILYLLLTDQCNFRCKYCFIENTLPNQHKFSMMSEKTAKKGIDLFAKCLKKNPPELSLEEKTVIFYGGEPLLNQSILKVVLDYISQLQAKDRLPENLKKILITNGSLIDQEIGKIIKDQEVSVSVSLDGWERINDSYRLDLNGNGTFKKTIRGIKILRDLEVPVSISCTITPKNLDYLEDVFTWFIEKIGINAMGFNLLVDLPFLSLSDEAYIERATRKLINCFKIGREKGVYEDRIGRKVYPFAKGYLHPKECGASGNQLVISPDGKVGVCQGYLATKKYFSGDVYSEFNPFDDSTFIEWSRWSPFSFSECLDCEALGFCGGSCPYNTELKYGTIWRVNKSFCIHSKIILEWLIWELFERKQMKGGDRE